jgi:hypothetical protein
MPTDPQRTQPAWRPPVQLPSPPPSTVPRWRRESDLSGEAATRWRRRFRLGVALLLFLASAGFLVWASFWLTPPRPAVLVLVGAGYETNLAIPHNAYGRHSLRVLADLTSNRQTPFVWRSGLLRLNHEPVELVGNERWDKGLDQVDAKTALIFVAAHGGADSDGAYLLPNDADPQDPQQRLRLPEVLDRLQQMPTDRNKVLVLDATQITAHWPLGMLHNDFARELEKLEGRVRDIPNLVVFSASGINQQSWVSEELRQSIFAYHLAEGLKGAADENHDGRVDALELHRYVSAAVERWVRTNREALQTPVLLPWGKEGEDRARGMHLTMIEQPYQPPDPAQVPTFTVPEGLLQAWQKCQLLADQIPAPVVYAPQAWRQYQETLLRYEQLLRAGDTENADQVAAQLPNLEREIRQAARLELESVDNTLTMSRLAGTAGPPVPLGATADDLLVTSSAELQLVWERIVQEQGKAPVSSGRLRQELSDLVLQRTATNPADNLERADRLLPLLRSPLHPRPAELHFLSMLAHHLPQKPAERDLIAVVGLALQVRRAAEQTALALREREHSYSEQLCPWIQPRVNQADEQRRLGQDLLFTTEAARWEKARSYFLQAQAQYEMARRDAEPVRRAFAIRDHVLAELPLYAHWLAGRPRQADPARQQEDDDFLANIEQIAQQVEQVQQLLEARSPAAKEPPTADELANLRRHADLLEGQLRTAANQLEQAVNALGDCEGLAAWRDTEALLAVPFHHAKKRMELLNSSRCISRRLLMQGGDRRSAASRGSNALPLGPAPLSLAEESVKLQARRQGRMALAALGQRWFDQPKEAPRENFDLVQHRLQLFSSESSWWESLGRAETEIAARWRELPPEIGRLADASRKSDLRVARPALQAADRLNRRFECQLRPSACEPREVLPARLARSYRQLLVHDLLLWQAQRTLDDHWFDENDAPGVKPYYEVAGMLFAEDAEKQVSQAQAEQAVAEMKRKLSRPGRLVVTAPTGRSTVLTSETGLDLDFALEPAEGATVPAGFPVVRIATDKLLQAQVPAAGAQVVWPSGAGDVAVPPRGKFTSALQLTADESTATIPRRQQSLVALHGFFRGQRLEATTPVDIYPVPDQITYQYPPPPRASIAVQAPKAAEEAFGAGMGALAIVLDCSGSMGELKDSDFNPKTKYNEATKALREVLTRVPRGTVVSLWVFGQAVPPQMTVPPEDTVRQVLPPTVWNPDDKPQLDGLMAQVEYPALRPWNESPIVRTILKAKADVAKVRGYKSILVLTDGMDNRFKQDAEFNRRGRDIPTVLAEEFGTSGIVLNIIGFKVPRKDREDEQTIAQFKVIERLPTPGRFCLVGEACDLAQELERSIRPRLRYWVDRGDNETLATLRDGGLDVGSIQANEQWFPGGLAPGGYQVRVRANRMVQRNAVLNAGDLLLLKLSLTPGTQDLQRVYVTHDHYAPRHFRDQEGWRLAVLQNQRLNDRQLQLFAMLEKDPERPEASLMQVKPRECWLELQAPGNETPFSLRWGFQAGHLAPAWRLDVPEWPTNQGADSPAAPVLQAWWSPYQEVPAAATVTPDATLKSVLDLKDHPVTVEGAPVVLERVRIEKHRVEVQAGQFAEQNCLAVRLRHPPDRPVRVQVNGWKPEGQEHRYYSKVNKCTALFWPVPAESQARSTITGLSLISINALKALAREGGFYVKMDNLGEPRATDTRPQPPIELK